MDNLKVLDFIETASKIGEVSLKIAEAAAAEKSAVAGKVEKLARLLSTAGLIDDHEVKQAATQLANPSSALDILENVIDEFNGQLKEARAKIASVNLGESAQDAPNMSKSSFDKYANYAGARRGHGELAPSDQALLALLDR